MINAPDISAFDWRIINLALRRAVRNLDPRILISCPALLIGEALAAVVTLFFFLRLMTGGEDAGLLGLVAVWMWLVVYAAVFIEVVTRERRAVRLERLLATRPQTLSKRLLSAAGLEHELVWSGCLAPDDLVLVEAGDLIPSDGAVVEGLGSVDESALTGRLSPVLRKPGQDRSRVVGGTRLLSHWVKVRVGAPKDSTGEAVREPVGGGESKWNATQVMLVGVALLILVLTSL